MSSTVRRSHALRSSHPIAKIFEGFFLCSDASFTKQSHVSVVNFLLMSATQVYVNIDEMLLLTQHEQYRPLSCQEFNPDLQLQH